LLTARLQVANSNPLPLNISIFQVKVPGALFKKIMRKEASPPPDNDYGNGSVYEELAVYISSLRLHPKKAFVSSNSGVYTNKPTGVGISNAALTMTGSMDSSPSSGMDSPSSDDSSSSSSSSTVWVMIPSTYDPEDAEYSMEVFASMSGIGIDRIR
jgi:hypothetical protein